MLKRNGNFAAIRGATALGGVLIVAVFGGLSSQPRKQNTPQSKGAGDVMVTEKTGLYCNVKALTPMEWVHHIQASKRLAGARLKTVELADGYAFQLQSESVPLADVADWVVNERKCCPFFDFEIELEGDGGPLWLKLRGKDGVKQFIRMEFKIPRE